MITLKNEKVDRIINIPTKLNEITPEVLTDLTKFIVLPKHYALIALCWKLNFRDVMFASKKQKESRVIPLIAKVNEEEKGYEFLEVGKKAILSRSAIEVGVHVHIPHAATLESINDWFIDVAKAYDNKAVSARVQDIPTGEFYLVEFKVLGVSQISGVVTEDTNSKDNYFLINE